MTYNLLFAHEPLFHTPPIKSLYRKDLYDLIFYSLFFNMSVTCTGFYVSIPVPDVSFCTIRFLHYIVEPIGLITIVYQIATQIFNIMQQNHLFLTYVQKQPTKHITYCQDSAKDIASPLIAHYHLSITNYPLFSGGIFMNTYKLVVQTIQNGKITGNASLSVSANSTMEARQKFMASHPPTATKKYKVVACAKQ